MKQDTYTPEYVTKLGLCQIIVVGTNSVGQHVGGAAAQAHQQFGLEWGIGEGLSGQTYALPTMEGTKALSLAIERFIDFAQSHTEYNFLLTKIGTGIAGYSEEYIVGMFRKVTAGEWPNNVTHPEGWQFEDLT